jgi:2,3-bisphosphoglycerate-dependent phosphoglycerate mutase
MKTQHTLLVLLLVYVTSGVCAQQVTTFILVRHAEKVSDGSKDPELTEAGKARALALTKFFKEVKIDAIYSTGFKRTQNTVTPLAMSKNLPISSYEAMKGDEIDQMLKKFPGGTIVISGHSNTTPWVANYLLGKEEFKDFDDNDYDNMLIVDVIDKGRAKATWFTY